MNQKDPFRVAFLSLLLSPFLTQAQESPYARVSSDKSPVVLDPHSITTKGLGPWTFGMQSKEAISKAPCREQKGSTDADDNKTQYYCSAWVSDRSLQTVFLTFSDDRLSDIDVSMGPNATNPSQLLTLIQRGLVLWKNMRIQSTVLLDGFHTPQPFSSLSANVILTRLQKQTDTKGALAVSLCASDQLPGTCLNVYEKSVWLHHEQSTRRILLTSTLVDENHIGPWQMGMSMEEALKHPACHFSEQDPTEKTAQITCSLLLPSGPQNATLSFQDNHLWKIYFQLHRRPVWHNDATLERWTAEALSFLHTVAQRYPLHLEMGNDGFGAPVQWSEKTITSKTIVHQLQGATQTVGIVAPSTYPMGVWFNPRMKLPEFIAFAPSFQYKVSLLRPQDIKPGSLGPWKQGMSIQEAARLPGCEKANVPQDSQSLPKKFLLSCRVALPGRTNISNVDLQFFDNRLMQEDLLLVPYRARDIDTLTAQSAFALRFFQRIAPSLASSLRVLAQEDELLHWLPTLPTPLEMARAIQRLRDLPAGQKDILEVKHRRDTPYKGFALALSDPNGLWLCQNMVATSYPGTNWIAEENAVDPHIPLSLASIQPEQIGPWRLGMQEEAISKNPACQPSETDNPKQTQIKCKVWLEHKGSTYTLLTFTNKKLLWIELNLRRGIYPLSKAQLQESLAPFVQHLQKTASLYTTTSRGADAIRHWLGEPASFHQALQPNVGVIDLLTKTSRPLILSIQDQARSIWLHTSRDPEKPLLGASSFSAHHLGPWHFGMSTQEALAQPGCQGETPHKEGSQTSLVCAVQVLGLYLSSTLNLFFTNNQLTQWDLYLLEGPFPDAATRQETAAFALDFLQSLQPKATLQAMAASLPSPHKSPTGPWVARALEALEKEHDPRRTPQLKIQFSDKQVADRFPFLLCNKQGLVLSKRREAP